MNAPPPKWVSAALLQEIAAVTPPDDRPRRELKPAVVDEPTPVVFPRSLRVEKRTARQAARLPRVEIRCAVLRIIEANEGATSADVRRLLKAEGYHLSESTVCRVLLHLVELGSVRAHELRGARDVERAGGRNLYSAVKR